MELKCRVNFFSRRKKWLPAIMCMCFFACAPISGLAGPPFLTDDPEPVDFQHSELYIASQQVKSADGRSGTLPQIEYNYGVAPNVQLHIIVPFAFNRPTGGASETGLGDTELGVKYRFMQETETSPMVGIFPILLTNTGSYNKGLGAGGDQLFLPLWIQKKWGKWQSYGGGGYWVSRALDVRDRWFAGWQLQKDMSDQLTVGGEIFHQTEQVSGQGGSTGFNLGGYYNFDENDHLLFSAGKGLQNVTLTNQLSTYVAYQWTW